MIVETSWNQEPEHQKDLGRIDPFRRLDSYLSMHQETAKKKGVLAEFNACRTLTRARVVLFGSKPKHTRCCRDICAQCSKR